MAGPLRRGVVGSLAIATLVVVAGCSSATPADPVPATTPVTVAPSTTPPVTFDTPPPSASPQQAAVVAYRNMWHAFVEAAKTSDPDDPNLGKYATGNALTLIVNALTRNRANGQVTLGDVVLDPSITEFKPSQDPTEVTVVDCVDSQNWLKYKASGGLVDDEPGARHRNTASLTLTSEGWKVAAFTLLGGGTC